MKEYRIDVKIKNNLILRMIEKRGYTSVGDFCKKNSISPCTVGNYINLKESPLNNFNEFKPSAYRLIDLLQCCPEDLWTEDQLTLKLEKNKALLELDKDSIQNYMNLNKIEFNESCPLLEARKEELKDKIEEVLNTLTPREKKVLKLRFEDGETLEEIGKKMGVLRERVRQIEAKALRKLRHPDRSDKLRDSLDL